MTTAAQTERELIGFDPGAEESQAGNRIFVNLRAGRIGETSKEPKEGFHQEKSVNKAGQEFIFYAKTLDHLTGYVDDIHWHVHQLPDGTKLSGWNITVDAGEKGIYVLQVGSKDRPFTNLMNVLLKVDFSKPARFVGFWSKEQTKQKVLLVSQGIDPETRKPVWIRGAHDTKWLSRLLYGKIKAGVPLDEKEERNISRMNDGSFNKDYPYIVEKADGSWSFDTWTNFLFEQMEQFVIPSVKAAAAERGRQQPPAIVPDEDIPAEFSGPAPAAADDDDIPF